MLDGSGLGQEDGNGGLLPGAKLGFGLLPGAKLGFTVTSAAGSVQEEDAVIRTPDQRARIQKKGRRMWVTQV